MICEYNNKMTKRATSQPTNNVTEAKSHRRCSNPYIRGNKKVLRTQRSASVERMHVFRKRTQNVRRSRISSDDTDSRKSSIKDEVFMSPTKLFEIVSFRKN